VIAPRRWSPSCAREAAIPPSPIWKLEFAERGCILDEPSKPPDDARLGYEPSYLCSWAGDLVVDRDPVRAATLFEKRCSLLRDGAASKVCADDVKKIRSDSARLKDACDKSDARACTERGKLLARHAPRSAGRSFARGCELRGIDVLYPEMPMSDEPIPDWSRQDRPLTGSERCGNERVNRLHYEIQFNSASHTSFSPLPWPHVSANGVVPWGCKVAAKVRHLGRSDTWPARKWMVAR
jgi:hypothetical protein